VVTPRGVIRSGEVALRGRQITYVGPARRGRQEGTAVRLRGEYVLPGFIDFQVNDADLFQDRHLSEKRCVERLGAVLRAQAAHGVTSLYLATIAMPLDRLERVLGAMAAYMADHNDDPQRTRLLGALVEGTFMNPECAGTHNPDLVMRPTRKVFDRLHRTGAMRQINIVPEWGDSALRLVRHATERGVLVGAGHFKCTADELHAAVDQGLRFIIHCTNGPTGTSTKVFHNGGALEAALTDDRLHLSLIIDRYHIHPRYVRDIIARKTPARVLAVSDIIFPVRPPTRPPVLFGVRTQFGPDGAYIRVAPPPGAQHGPITLAGNPCWSMDTIFANTVDLLHRGGDGVWTAQHPSRPFDPAVVEAARMCATIPARLAGLHRAPHRLGALQRGHTADVAIGSFRPGREGLRFDVRRVYRAGTVVTLDSTRQE